MIVIVVISWKYFKFTFLLFCKTNYLTKQKSCSYNLFINRCVAHLRQLQKKECSGAKRVSLFFRYSWGKKAFVFISRNRNAFYSFQFCSMNSKNSNYLLLHQWELFIWVIWTLIESCISSAWFYLGEETFSLYFNFRSEIQQFNINKGQKFVILKINPTRENTVFNEELREMGNRIVSSERIYKLV